MEGRASFLFMEPTSKKSKQGVANGYTLLYHYWNGISYNLGCNSRCSLVQCAYLRDLP